VGLGESKGWIQTVLRRAEWKSVEFSRTASRVFRPSVTSQDLRFRKWNWTFQVKHHST
jgi:hypothetical protein